MFQTLVTIFGMVFSREGRDLITALAGDRAAQDEQAADAKAAGLNQLAAEFSRDRRGFLDDIADALNRLPRPLFALGTFALFIYAFKDPVGFAARMEGITLVPEPMWWVMGTVIAFYFAGRMDHYRRMDRRDPAEVRATVETIRDIEALNKDATETDDYEASNDNAALDTWRAARGET